MCSQALGPKHLSTRGSLRASGHRQLGLMQARAKADILQHLEPWQEEQHLFKLKAGMKYAILAQLVALGASCLAEHLPSLSQY